jgi:hypothetical protein
MELDPDGDAAAVIELAQSVHYQDEDRVDTEEPDLAPISTPAQEPEPEPEPEPQPQPQMVMV